MVKFSVTLVYPYGTSINGCHCQFYNGCDSSFAQLVNDS